MRYPLVRIWLLALLQVLLVASCSPTMSNVALEPDGNGGAAAAASALRLPAVPVV